MADEIDELVGQLESFAGFQALPLAAREIIQTFVDTRLRQSLEKVARDARRYAEDYKAKAAADGIAILIDPAKTRRKKGWGNAQKADYWSGVDSLVRSHMPRPQGRPGV